MPLQTEILPRPSCRAVFALAVRDVAAASAYYEEIFDAAIVARVASADGLTLLQSDLHIGESVIRLCAEAPALGHLSPYSLGGSAAVIHLYLQEVETLWQRALEAGVRVIQPLALSEPGLSCGRFVDPFGQHWVLSNAAAPGHLGCSESTRPARAFSLLDPNAKGPRRRYAWAA